MIESFDEGRSKVSVSAPYCQPDALIVLCGSPHRSLLRPVSVGTVHVANSPLFPDQLTVDAASALTGAIQLGSD